MLDCALLQSGDRMRRREFVRLIGAAAVALPSAALAQQNGTQRRIGVLLPASSSDLKVKNDLVAFARQLQSFGWSEGQNLQIDYRWAGDNVAEMQNDAKELIAAQPDILFARGTPATAALLRNTRTIPVVFAVVSDPVGEGFVASVARPGGNATGFT